MAEAVDLGDLDRPELTSADYDGDLDLNLLFNLTSREEWDCIRNAVGDEASSASSAVVGGLSCASVWDGILCWPATPAGSTAVMSCREELNGVKYDATQNATRICMWNGTWTNYSNYKSCASSSSDPLDPNSHINTDSTIMIYFSGYTISLVALIIALCIFIHFKDLRCLRNTIHTHLLVTYAMADSLWIITATLQIIMGEHNKGSCVIVIFLHYFHLTNFFWMFVEGFYLYMLVVKTFTADKIRLRVYAFIGWGMPLPIIFVWTIVKANWHYYPSDGSMKFDLGSYLSNCPWMVANTYDWIYIIPAIIVLFVNILFLVKIMWVLITKLRSANSVETQQYRKGSKALLVLIPLLGLTYVLVLSGPTEGVVSVVFAHIRAVLLSIQGFTVTVFYCFLNTEVRNTVRHRWERWRINRSFVHSQSRRSQGHRSPKEGSRTFSENARLYNSFQDRGQRREISVSEVTTVANFSVGGASTQLANFTPNNVGGRFIGASTIKENQV